MIICTLLYVLHALSIQSQSQSYFTSRDFFATELLRSQSLCNTLSDEKMGLFLMNMLGVSLSVRIAHIACYSKFFLLHYIQFLREYRLCKADHAYFKYLMLQRQLSNLNGSSLTTAMFKPHIFYVWLCLVLYCEQVHSHDCEFFLLVVCTILLY
jgi:hypothetical protein